MASIGRAALAALTGIAVMALCNCGAWASDPTDFYSNKTVTVVVGYPPGGGYDLLSRVLSRHLGQFISGNPHIIVQNMPGAGSRIAATYIYNVAPQDGTVIGTVSQYLPLAHLLENDLSFESSKFHWIGSLGQGGNNVMFSWHATGIKSVEDLKQKSLIVGSAGPQTNTEYYPAVLNALVGTKFKSIPGYSGTGDVLLAVERGELQGMASIDWPGLKRSRPMWLNDKLINIFLQIGSAREEELPDVPLLSELGHTQTEQEILDIVSSGVDIGRPFFVGPGVPNERVQMLRDAFDKMRSDPDFLSDIKAAKLVINPISGVELQGIVGKSTNPSPELLDKLKAALDPRNLGRE